MQMILTLTTYTLLSLFVFSNALVAEENKKSESLPSCSKVEFSSIEITCLKKGVGVFNSEERAEKITSTLKNLSKDSLLNIDKIQIVSENSYKLIMLEDKIILHLTADDLLDDPNDLKAFDEKTEAIVSNIKTALTSELQKNQPQKLLTSIALTAACTLGLILLLLLIKKFFSFTQIQIQKSDGTIIKNLHFQNYEILTAKRVVNTLTNVNSALKLLSILVVFYIYVPLVFSFYPQTAKWTSIIYGYILEPLKTISKVIINFIPNLFYLIIIAILTNYLLKFIKFVFDEIENGSLTFEGFYTEWAEPTYKLVRLIVVALAMVMAFPYIPGSGSPAFQGVTVFFGVLVSFGSSSAISNIVAGVVLTYMRPFKVGDFVKISETSGDVVEKSLLVTRLHTRKNVDVTIPNSMVLSGQIINYSSSANTDGLIVNTTVTIGYDVPWKDVHQALKASAKKCQLLDQNKEAFVLQTALNDFSVAYELNAITRKPNQLPAVYSELHENIQNEFNETGIEIMSPIYHSLRDGNESTIPKIHRKPNEAKS